MKEYWEYNEMLRFRTREITPDEFEMWDRLVKLKGSVFQSVKWTAMFEPNVKRIGIFNQGGELVGGVIYQELSSFLLTIIRNPPFTPYIGPFLSIESEKPFSYNTMVKNFSLTINEHISKKKGNKLVFLSFIPKFKDLQPFFWDAYKVTVAYTYRLKLGIDENFLFDNFSPERRKNIRKALKDNVRVRKILSNEDIKEFKELVFKSYSRQDILKSYAIAIKIIDNFIRSDSAFGILAYKGCRPLAGVMCVYDTHTAYYIIGGVNFDYLHSGAMTLAMWEAIKYSKSIGLKEFDFEGSMVKSIEKFFRGFGGDLVPYYRVSKAPLLMELGLKFFKRQIF